MVKLPGGVFKPYAGVSTAILVFTKTNSGGTDFVWFYDVQADGWSLDDKRTPLLPEERLGSTPSPSLTDEEHTKNNLPDVLGHIHVVAASTVRLRKPCSNNTFWSRAMKAPDWPNSGRCSPGSPKEEFRACSLNCEKRENLPAGGSALGALDHQPG